MTTDPAPSCGIIGFGRIARRLVGRMDGWDGPRLCALLVRPEHHAEAVTLVGKDRVATGLQDFMAMAPGVTVECASPAALAEFGPPLLRAGSDIVPLSLAALADPRVEDTLLAAAHEGPGRLEIAAGAMASLDFLAAAREDELRAVTFRAIYPASRLNGTPAEPLLPPAAQDGPASVFRGTVREAVRLYPRHVNLSVAVALAGLGLDRTQAEILADAGLTQATFEIEADAAPGPVFLQVRGRDAGVDEDPIDYTTFSLLRVLRRRTARVMV